MNEEGERNNLGRRGCARDREMDAHALAHDAMWAAPPRPTRDALSNSNDTWNVPASECVPGLLGEWRREPVTIPSDHPRVPRSPMRPLVPAGCLFVPSAGPL